MKRLISMLALFSMLLLPLSLSALDLPNRFRAPVEYNPVLAVQDWRAIGIALPKQVPVLVNNYMCRESGLYHLVWHVMVTNNMKSSCDVWQLPNIVFMAQLRINRDQPLTFANWLAPDNYPNFHVGQNVTPWDMHYANFDMNLYLNLNAGDIVEIWMLANDGENGFPLGGAFFDRLKWLRNFQMVRVGDYDNSTTSKDHVRIGE